MHTSRLQCCYYTTPVPPAQPASTLPSPGLAESFFQLSQGFLFDARYIATRLLYDAINASNDAGESTVFIEFMMSAIKASLMDAISTSDEMSDGKMDKATLRWKKIEEYLKTHDYIMNANVRELCGVSAATANRILASLVEEGRLNKYHEGRHWAYNINW
jgi:Fic family protein